MTYKQEPCPLCGRDMTAIETYPGRGELYCGHCDLTIGGNDAKTPEELIALMDGSEHRRLKAENANLQASNELIAEDHAALCEQNAKLRELVRDLWPFVKADWVSACPNRECCLFEECDADSEYECLIEEHMAGRMRELEIEVN